MAKAVFVEHHRRAVVAIENAEFAPVQIVFPVRRTALGLQFVGRHLGKIDQEFLEVHAGASIQVNRENVELGEFRVAVHCFE